VIELFERSNLCPVGGYQIFMTFVVDSKMVIFVDAIFIVPGNSKYHKEEIGLESLNLDWFSGGH
jgi:hypothetical protein